MKKLSQLLSVNSKASGAVRWQRNSKPKLWLRVSGKTNRQDRQYLRGRVERFLIVLVFWRSWRLGGCSVGFRRGSSVHASRNLSQQGDARSHQGARGTCVVGDVIWPGSFYYRRYLQQQAFPLAGTLAAP